MTPIETLGSQLRGGHAAPLPGPNQGQLRWYYRRRQLCRPVRAGSLGDLTPGADFSPDQLQFAMQQQLKQSQDQQAAEAARKLRAAAATTLQALPQQPAAPADLSSAAAQPAASTSRPSMRSRMAWP